MASLGAAYLKILTTPSAAPHRPRKTLQVASQSAILTTI